MGIAFVEAASEHRAALEEWLNNLSQITYSSSSASVQAATPAAATRAGDNGTAAGGADARGSIARLVNLLLAKGILTDDDAEMILQKRKTVL
jgi:hypothetical protein